LQVEKRDYRREPFTVEKTRGQIEFSVKNTKLSPIEFESLIHFPQKEVIKSEEIQKIIISTAVNKIDIDNDEWNYVAGRASMFNLYRNIYKRTKHEVQDWQEHIKYLVRNDYYRKDILNFLDNLNEKQIKYIDKLLEHQETKSFDWKMTFAQVELLKSKYLIKNKRGTIEYPILADIVNALILSRGDETFEKIFYYIHNQIISLATPFKRNLRRPNGNVGSCFIGENPDSLAGLMKGFTDMAFISKNGGGIGWYLGKVRPGDTYSYKIVKSNNITKWVKIVNDIAVAVNQAGARPGAITLGLDWWHLDIYSFLEIKSELSGDLREKAFDIFPQLIVDKWFVEKKKKNEDVYLFNHYEYKKQFGIDVTELVDKELYKVHQHIEELVKEGKWKHYKKVNSKELWKKAMWTWIEIGDFYIVHKDNLNKSNYLKYDPEGGITKQANLCVESFSLSKAPTKWKEESDGENRITTESDGMYHSCNLCSIVATNLVKATDKELKEVCYYTTLILDRSIDEGEMPVLEAKNSSEALRNVGIGIVGQGDYMAYNNMMYDTKEGQEFGEKFVEKISYYSYQASIELAEKYGSYPLFKPENYDKILGYNPKELNKMSLNGFDWVELQKDIKNKGIRNFYLLALAPNSSTGILMNATASYLPVYNKEMYQTLADLSLPILPKYVKNHYWSYKTKFQYHPKHIIEYTRKIQKWIDTGISLEININPELCKINEISDAIIDGFNSGELKTVYYSLTIDGKKSSACTDCAN
jgi:ribonucleoside-diphosphate reductase alpha chain